MKIIIDEEKRIADMVKHCREAREEEENVTILVDRELIDKARLATAKIIQHLITPGYIDESLICSLLVDVDDCLLTALREIKKKEETCKTCKHLDCNIITGPHCGAGYNWKPVPHIKYCCNYWENN